MELNITVSRDPKVWGNDVSYQAAYAAAEILCEDLYLAIDDRYPHAGVTVTSGWDEEILAVDRHGQEMPRIIDQVGRLIERLIPVCLARVHKTRVWPVWVNSAAGAVSYSCETDTDIPGAWLSPGPHYGMVRICRTEEEAREEVESWEREFA